MLRVAARRLSSFCSTQPSWRPNQAASAIVSRNPTNGGEYFHLPHRVVVLHYVSNHKAKEIGMKMKAFPYGEIDDLKGPFIVGGLGNNFFWLVGLITSDDMQFFYVSELGIEVADSLLTKMWPLMSWKDFHPNEDSSKVVDNSGAKKVMCIQALKGKKGARLGDTIVASVKEAMPNGKVKKGKVVYGVVVRAAMQRGRCDGSEVKFDDNAVVLVDKQGQPIGTRVFGPVPHELRKKKHVKILTLAEHIA
ncbi:hypothetical protein GH714_039786 [Hevea brasiliensis]|uniref:Uncharacterized protein n=1 Tax=Hevea brasiliensis TaxID=3981 RepID=A0A6A6KEL3_HEVBR|nr:hypothetical protein GH714_039786 [Hevea brasiliensis]